MLHSKWMPVVDALSHYSWQQLRFAFSRGSAWHQFKCKSNFKRHAYSICYYFFCREIKLDLVLITLNSDLPLSRWEIPCAMQTHPEKNKWKQTRKILLWKRDTFIKHFKEEANSMLNGKCGNNYYHNGRWGNCLQVTYYCLEQMTDKAGIDIRKIKTQISTNMFPDLSASVAIAICH